MSWVEAEQPSEQPSEQEAEYLDYPELKEESETNTDFGNETEEYEQEELKDRVAASREYEAADRKNCTWSPSYKLYLSHGLTQWCDRLWYFIYSLLYSTHYLK